MLNAPAVAYMAVFAGSLLGMIMWYGTGSILLTTISFIVSAVAGGWYTYSLLKK